VSAGIDLARLGDAARALPAARGPGAETPAPPGQRIALASDQAFAFTYHHAVEGWRAEGAEIIPFSPLGDEAPDAAADAVIVPGGYPELYAGRLAGNQRLMAGLRRRAAAGALIHGECGGYMLLGRGLVDAGGERHAMAGLLALETSFARRRLSLGYRRAVTGPGQPLAAPGTVFRAHEFHYATVVEESGAPLFAVTDMAGHALGEAGLADGRVCGSFLHVIDVE
jgi:cobyrinic acid a,c-diamide synthase